jgi:uncharacterized membrane protein YfcA
MSLMSPEEEQRRKEADRKLSRIFGIICLIGGVLLSTVVPSIEKSGILQFILGVVAIFLILTGILYILDR